MKKAIISGILIVLCITYLFIYPNDKYFKYKEETNSTSGQVSAQKYYGLNSSELDIDKFINKNIIKGRLPGISVVITQGDKTIYEKNFGYADLDSNKKITSKTLFELGSNSKAFTALGVLKLEQDGLIKLNDPITKYISWLQMKYQGMAATVTIEELLHHTSGIPSYTIAIIPEANDGDKTAIEKTVRKLAGIELSNKPGSKHTYATINYDVLGLLIEKVSGEKYEDYIEKNVLKPMGLNSTYMYKSKIELSNMSKGYKIEFSKLKNYEAPSYSGNKPAGYIISNSEDMAAWMKIQLGTSKLSSFDSKLIEASHIPNQNLNNTENDMRYAAGWYIYDNNGPEIFHSGSNPNYSSHIVLRPEEKLGVAVLCNTNSFYASTIGNGITNMLLGKNLDKDIGDFNIFIDAISTKIIIISSILSCILLFLLTKLIRHIHLKSRTFQPSSKNTIIKVVILSLSLFSVSYIIYSIPYFLLNKKTWEYIFVWYPNTIKIALFLIYTNIGLTYIYVLLKCLFKKSYEKN